jgi:hypothetical protein
MHIHKNIVNARHITTATNISRFVAVNFRLASFILQTKHADKITAATKKALAASNPSRGD